MGHVTRMCAMTPACASRVRYVYHNSSHTFVPWLFTFVPWRIYMCAMTHSHVCHDSFTCVTRAQKRTFSVQKQKMFSRRFTSPGRMSRTPRAGTGDSACRSWHYRCSMMLIREGNLSMCGTFLIRLLPPSNHRGKLPQRACFQVVYASFCESQPMGSFCWQKYDSGPWTVAECWSKEINWDITIVEICTFPSPPYDMIYSHVCRGSFTCVLLLIHMCAMAHLHVCHDFFTCVPWLIHVCAITHSHVCHDSFTCVPWLIHMCAMAHSHVYHDSITCVPWLIHLCVMTYWHVYHDSFTCSMTHSHVCHDSFTFVQYCTQPRTNMNMNEFLVFT